MVIGLVQSTAHWPCLYLLMSILFLASLCLTVSLCLETHFVASCSLFGLFLHWFEGRTRQCSLVGASQESWGPIAWEEHGRCCWELPGLGLPFMLSLCPLRALNSGGSVSVLSPPQTCRWGLVPAQLGSSTGWRNFCGPSGELGTVLNRVHVFPWKPESRPTAFGMWLVHLT